MECGDPGTSVSELVAALNRLELFIEQFASVSDDSLEARLCGTGKPGGSPQSPQKPPPPSSPFVNLLHKKFPLSTSAGLANGSTFGDLNSASASVVILIGQLPPSSDESQDSLPLSTCRSKLSERVSHEAIGANLADFGSGSEDGQDKTSLFPDWFSTASLLTSGNKSINQYRLLSRSQQQKLHLQCKQNDRNILFSEPRRP